MADGRNPFERVFNPDGGGIGGLIGSAFGVQTQQERFGDVQSKAMQELSRLQQEGNLTPQQTILKFMGTPQGMELFTSGDPKAMDSLTKWAATVQAPTPQVNSVGPGSQPIITQPGGYTALPQNQSTPTIHGGTPGSPTYIARSDGSVQNMGTTPITPQVNSVAPGARAMVTNPDGSVTDRGTTPTTMVQDFMGMVGLSKMSPEKMQELATLWATPNESRSTDKQVALKALVDSGVLDAGTANKILGGIIQIKPVFNSVGENTGDIQIIDMSNPTAPQMNVVRPGAGTGGNVGATAPTKENPKGIKDPEKLTMFLGTGVWPQGLSYLNTIVKSVIDPSLDVTGGEGDKATARNRNLDNLNFALTLFPEGDGKTNLVIKEAQALAAGKFTDNLDAVRQGIRLYDLANRELAADEQITMKNSSKDQALRAQRRIEGWRGILRALPERADMEALEDSIRKGTAGAQTLRTGVQALVGAAGKTTAAVSDAANPPAVAPAPAPGQQPAPQRTQEAPQPGQSTVAPAPAPVPARGSNGASKAVDPNEAPTAALPADQGVKDIQTMPVGRLLKLAPEKLTPPQRKALLDRIKEIREKTSVRQ